MNKLFGRGQNVALVTIGNVIRTASVFICWAILARALPSGEFGVFVVSYSVMTLVSQLSESGLGISVVKFISQYSGDSERLGRLINATSVSRLTLTLVGSIALLLSSRILADLWFHNHALIKPLMIVAVGAVCSSYFGYMLSIYQGFSRFIEYSALSVLSGILLIGGLASTQLIAGLSTEAALIVVAASFLLPAAVGHLFIRRPIWGAFSIPDDLSEVLRFSRWTGLSALFVLVIMQGDILLLTHFTTMVDVSTYSVGQRLAFSVSVLTNSFLTVLLPQLMASQDEDTLRLFWRRVLLLMCLGPVVLGIAVLVAPFVVRIFFGSEFSAATEVFNILFGAFLLSFVTNALGFVGLTLNYPQVTTLSLLLQLLVLLGLGVVFVPSYGAVGMAYCVLASRLVGFCTVTFLTGRLLWRKNEVLVT